MDIYQYGFNRNLLYRSIPLISTRDIVQYSYIVQNSISYLDLQLCRHSRLALVDGNYQRLWSPARHFINTEEKCRKILAPSRSLLYTLHLDLPKGRELPLNEGGHLRQQRNTSFGTANILPHIGEMYIHSEFYYFLLSDYILYTSDTLGQETKIYDWLSRCNVIKAYEIHQLDIRIISSLLEHLYKYKLDFSVRKEFYQQFQFKLCLSRYENLKHMVYFLYNACYSGRNFEEDRPLAEAQSHEEDLIDYCFDGTFINICLLLMCIDSPRLSSYTVYAGLLLKIRYFNQLALGRAGYWMSVERRCLMLQMLIIALNMSKGDMSKDCISTLSAVYHVVWDSVGAPYLSLLEIHRFCRELLPPDEIFAVQWFYSNVIGEIHERIEPRSLKHICRTAVRKQFYIGKQWIPDAIQQLNLPEELKVYLNLKMDFRSVHSG